MDINDDDDLIMPVTDLDKFVALYAEVGIKLEPRIVRNRKLTSSISNKEFTVQVLELNSLPGQSFGGDTDAYTELVFHESGKFLEQNFWQ